MDPLFFTFVAVAATILYMLYRRSTRDFDFFVRQGIPGPKPLPVVGNLWGIWKRNLVEYDLQMFREYGKIVGVYDATVPKLLIADAGLIRNVLVKDFDHFVNRWVLPSKPKYFRKFLSASRNQEWKDIRTAVTPTFTTGKIKKMSPLIIECASQLCAKMMAAVQVDGRVDAKKIFSHFTMDVITKCVFGMKVDNLGEADDSFMNNARGVFNSDNARNPALLLALLLKEEWQSVFSDELWTIPELQFFFDLCTNLIRSQSESNMEHNDFIHASTEVIKQVTKEVNGAKVPVWTPEEVEEVIVSQSVIFLLAGFDTTASTLTSGAFLLAKYPEVQEKLYDQIMDKLEEHGEVCHEMVLDFPYLDQVIHEILRLYSPVVRLDRECNKSVTYDGIHIKEGMNISIPIYTLHYSEEYYPEPEKFDPERWSPENKAKINPYAYVPFGLGPRNCVGMRFAMEELKIALCTVVSKLRFVPVPDMPDKLQFEKGYLLVVQPIEVLVGVEER